MRIVYRISIVSATAGCHHAANLVCTCAGPLPFSAGPNKITRIEMRKAHQTLARLKVW